MQALSRIVTALTLLFALSLPAIAERPRPLGWALDAMRTGNWETAELLALRDGAVAADVIEWHRLRAGEGSYSDVIAFLERRSNWPGEPLLRKRSESVVIVQRDAAILAFFAETPAQTPEGIVAHAAALARAGKSADAEAIIVEAWRTAVMGRNAQALFLTEHANLLKEHHVARLNAMLWKRNGNAARSMLKLVPKSQVALAEARLGLQNRVGNVDTLITQVPKSLATDPGLAHDRFEWRVRKRRWEDAKAFLHAQSLSAERLGQPNSVGQSASRLGARRDA